MIIELSRSDLQKKLDFFEKIAIVDLGPPESYDRVHLQDAKSLPQEVLEKRARSVLPDRGTQIVLYNAASPEKLQEAARTLQRLGYYNVFVYPGGLKDWQDGGLPTGTNVYPYPGQTNPAYQFTSEPDVA